MSVMGRIFAAMYDRMMAGTEDAGLRDHRGAILSRARGRVLEIGAGTGANLDHYGDGVTELVLAEPEEPMAKRLRAKATKGEVVAATAEDLPFPDASFDTVVSTLVLCTVRDPLRAIAEIRRVLKPDGQLLFIEHVRSDDERVAKWQDRLLPIWKVVGHGCNPNRPTGRTLAARGFVVESESWRLPKAPPIVRPVIEGVARPG